MEAYKSEFIEFMCQCGVLTFGDFTTKSGRKTPFFVNTGNYTTGSQLKKLGEFYAHAIHAHFGTDFQTLYGPAYKGIPLAVTTTIALSDQYNAEINYTSNRKEEKDHGDVGILLGHKIKSGEKVVIIEDVTTAGTSINETMPIFEKIGSVDVLGLVVSVDRMERGSGTQSALSEIQDKYQMKAVAIVTMAEVIEHLYNKNINGKVYITEEIMTLIKAYYVLYGVQSN